MLLPEQIGRFPIIRAIEEGGMGRVYLGRDPDPNIGRLVAIKLLREGFDNHDFRERFNREAKAASRFHHANIVTIFETGLHDDQPYIVMEYVSGSTLASIIKKRAPLPLYRKLILMEELFAGLHYAHRKNVIHRDIKPANIMLDDEGTVRILDFGIARLGSTGANETVLTKAGMIVGTLNYMAPEQLAGEPLDGRADMFAAGTVFYELLSYRPAFRGKSDREVVSKILTATFEPLDRACPDLDPRLIDIVYRCMQKDPSARLADCGAVKEAIADVRSSLSHAARATLTASTLPVVYDEETRVAVDTPPALTRHVQELLNRATIALETGRIEAATVYVEQALQIDPESKEGLRVRDATDRMRREIAELQSGPSRAAGPRFPSTVFIAAGVVAAMAILFAVGFYRNDVAPTTTSNVAAPIGAPVETAASTAVPPQQTAKNPQGEAAKSTAPATRASRGSAPTTRPVERGPVSANATPALSPPPETAQAPTAQPVNRQPTTTTNADASPAPASEISRPAPASTAPEAPPSGTGGTARAETPSDESAIREVLQRYAAAYEALNPNAVKAVFPSVNTATLTNMFRNYASLKQQVEVDSVQVTGQTAIATGIVTSAPVVRVGSVKPQRLPATFRLRKANGGWVIESVTLG